MTVARKRLVCLEATPYYHCISRCVRRAFLCGLDSYSGRDFSHRRQWVVDRLRFLSSVFAVEVCAYAVMSNHYHLVVRVRKDIADGWSDAEVIERWFRLYSPDVVFVDKFRSGEALLPGEDMALADWVKQKRKLLFSLSRFMGCLNESLARQANAEDKCTGRYWEGRFKSQALLDEAAILTAMAYVDLNPVRACMASTPEDSAFTSVQERAYWLRKAGLAKPVENNPLKKKSDSELLDAEHVRFSNSPWLAGFSGDLNAFEGIPYSELDYYQLVDSMGRIQREGKRGSIDSGSAEIMERLGISKGAFIKQMSQSGLGFSVALGCTQSLRRLASLLSKHFIRRNELAHQLFIDPEPG